MYMYLPSSFPLSFTVPLTNFLTYTVVVLLVFQDFWSLQGYKETESQTDRQTDRDKKRTKREGREADRWFPGSSSAFQSHITQLKSLKSLENNVNHVDINHVLHCAH